MATKKKKPKTVPRTAKKAKRRKAPDRARRTSRARAPTRKKVAPRPRKAAAAAWSSLTAFDIMHADVVTVATSTPLSEVEQILSEHRITGVPVTDEAGQIVGVLSVRDLVERYAQDPAARPRRGMGFYSLSSDDLDDDFEAFELPEEAEETAGEVMTAELFSVRVGDDLSTVARQMVLHGIHRILVQDGAHVVGIATTTDILRAVAG